MKIKLLSIFIFFFAFANAQTLTVEKIMRDPKWIGSSPSNVFWSQDSKSVYFSWNPEGKISDSGYTFSIGANGPQKSSYAEVQKANALNNSVYNNSNTMMVYTYRGDLYLNELKSGKTTRITQTEDLETAPKFVMKDEWIVYNRSQN